MPFALIAALAVADPQAAQPAPVVPRQHDIVVTAPRTKALTEDFAACARQRCTPEHDAATALALSQAQFLAGAYEDARATLRTAFHRTEPAAKTHPLPVAALLRARTRIDAHLGEYDEMLKGMIRQLRVLKEGLPDGDPNTLAAQVQLADTNLHVGFVAVAEGEYRSALARAIANADRATEAGVRFRLAALAGAGGRGVPSPGDRRRVAEVLAPIIASNDPALRRYATPARLIVARMAERAGATGSVEAVLRDAGHDALPAPQLVSSAPIDLGGGRSSTCQTDFDSGDNFVCQDPRNLVTNEYVEHQWIDVAFWITPQGTGRDAEVLRQSNQLVGDWPSSVVRSVNGRRYAAGTTEDGGPGTYRVERYTLTAPLVLTTGSRIASRSSALTLEIADITPR